MSLTLNMVGGGGGGLSATDALLRVQAPAGSTVTITKGTTTKSDQGHENADNTSLYDYYFIIHQSQFDATTPWTVTATLGTQSASATVIISANDEYDIALFYGVYLYNRGDKCESGIGGGWTIETYNSDRITWASDHLQYYVPSSNYTSLIHTTNKIDLSQYTTLHAKIGTNIACSLGICANANRTNPSMVVQTNITSNGRVETEYSVDISNVTASDYACIFINTAGSTTSYVDMYEMWLTE